MATITGVAAVGRQGTLTTASLMLPAATWYVRDTGVLGYSAIIKWSKSVSTPSGTLRRQTAPAGGDERVFIAIQSATGTTGSTEPTWVVTQGNTTTDNTVTWMEATGQAGMNGDLTNCPNWTATKGIAILIGFVIKNNAGTFLFICTTAGLAGSGAEPTWNTTTGQTTADNTVTWTSIGAVGNYGQWAAPHAHLYNSLIYTDGQWAAAGDTIYIASDHAETTPFSNFSFKGRSNSLPTAATPIWVYSVPTGTIPPTSALAGANIAYFSNNMVFRGNPQAFFFFGITFSSLSLFQIGGSNSISTYFDTCTFISANGLQTGGIDNSSSMRCVLTNCTIVATQSNANVQILAGYLDLIGCTLFVTGSPPTTAFATTTGNIGNLRVRDCDISMVTGNLVSISATAAGTVSFENCKLASGVTLSTGTPVGQSGVQAKVWNCDSIATNYRFYVASYMATLQTSTSVHRWGGASDGKTPISWQIVSTTHCAKLLPFVSEEIAVWNSIVGVARTATIYLTCATSLTNADVYIELEYLGSASTPIGTADLSSRNLIGSSSALTTDAVSTWTGGLGNNYNIVVSFTAQMQGVVKCRIYVGKPSITINVDPAIIII